VNAISQGNIPRAKIEGFHPINWKAFFSPLTISSRTFRLSEMNKTARKNFYFYQSLPYANTFPSTQQVELPGFLE